MKEMGRPKKAANAALPPRMLARRYASGVVAYYYNGKEKRIPLGRDLNRARLEWAKLENAGDVPGTFAAIAAEWKKTELAKRGPYTQKQYEAYLVDLEAAFGKIPLDSIEPVHCQQYLYRRSAKIRANREMSLFSTIFNWARRCGLTRSTNPMPGIEKNREAPRKIYVTDADFKQAYESAHATVWYQDALDLLQLAGQRPGDTLAMMWQHEIDGCIWVTQAKTGTKLRIEIEGELAAVLERIRTRPRKVKSIYIIADDAGQRITVDRLQKQHVQCRGDMRWQIRDVRKKTGTDVESLRDAQRLLGHRTEITTARVYRALKGEKVKPLR
jgi:integrase